MELLSLHLPPEEILFVGQISLQIPPPPHPVPPVPGKATRAIGTSVVGPHPSSTLPSQASLSLPVATKAVTSSATKPSKFYMQGHCRYGKKELVLLTLTQQCVSNS